MRNLIRNSEEFINLVTEFHYIQESTTTEYWVLFQTCYWEYGAPLLPIRITTHLPYHLAIPFLGIYLTDITANKWNDIYEVITAVLSVTLKTEYKSSTHTQETSMERCPGITVTTNKIENSMSRMLPVDVGDGGSEVRINIIPFWLFLHKGTQEGYSKS